MPEARLADEERLRFVDENFDTAERKGTAMVRSLAPLLRALGLPADGYVIVNVETGDHVTGKTRLEAQRAYRQAHAGALGWAKRIGDLENPGDA
jgi:hypothetical protein